jgi:hypothetical protein
MATAGFEFVRNAATVDANPNVYPLKAGESFKKGDAVTIIAGEVTKVSATTVSNVLGVMAASIDAPAGQTTYGPVYDSAENVYRVTYTGTDPKVGDVGLKFADARTVDADGTGGPIAVRAVNTANKTVDISFTKRLFS